MAKSDFLTQERLRQVLHYDPDTGIFRWKVSPSNSVKFGSIAGCVNTIGYWQISIDNERCLGHRIAWRYMTGNWPINDIDHKDRDRSNNRWDNLREATRGQNLSNSKSRCASGLKGAYYKKHRKKWFSHIRHDGIIYRLGDFDTAEEAHAAYAREAKRLHGEFARTT